ncbi:S8 family serine peptidase [Streptomyces sp. NPDC048172]|uniref:S8 family peptidase n=1 Tax=Streptomyces sp. NPDC048172 TaxID=3365505 RepID=UPI00371B3E7E
MANHVSRNKKRRITLAVGAAVALTGGATLLTLPASAAPAEGTVYGADAKDAVKGSYVVTLKDGTGIKAEANGEGLAEEYGGKLRRAYRSAVNGFSVNGLSGEEARRLAADDKVDKVVQNQRVTIAGTQADPTWGLDRIDQAKTAGDKKYTYPDGAGAGSTVYVLDTGVHISHKDFGGRASYGFNSLDGSKKADDKMGHGTHVAGTVAGAKYGVAKKAKVVAVKVLNDGGTGTTESIVAGIDWVTKNHKGPSVANMSIVASKDPVMDAALRKSIASGVTYAVAAGNEYQDASKLSPARVKEAITVAASDKADKQADFSSFGKIVDLYGPGVDVVSLSHKNNTGTATMSGTSMASPHVAGAAALYTAAHKSATPAQVASALTKGATKGAIKNPSAGTPNKLLRVVK